MKSARKTRKKYIRYGILLIVLGCFVLLAYFVDLLNFGYESRQLVEDSQAFSFANPDARARILVAGDSTAVGTGAEHPLLSIAGRFHSDFPNAEIVNVAENGAKARDVLEQVKSAEGRFDLAVVQAGGNDILYFTPKKQLFEDVRELLQETQERATHVVYLAAGDVGLLPAFDPPVSWIYEIRSREILPEIERIARENGIIFIDLYSVKASDLPVPNFERYAAPDFLHLNADGYGIWYEMISTALQEAGVEL